MPIEKNTKKINNTQMDEVLGENPSENEIITEDKSLEGTVITSEMKETESTTIDVSDNILLKQQVGPKKKKSLKFPNILKNFRFTAFFISLGFGLMLSSGGLYFHKYPYGFDNKTNTKAPISFPKVLSAQKESPQSYQYTLMPPGISAKAFGVYYRDKTTSNEYIEMIESQKDLQLPMASLTKLMTALVAIDLYELDKEVLIPSNCVNLKELSNVGFQGLEVFTLQDLLYGLLVRSGADAGCAIANINGKDYFISKMNEKAKDLNMTKTKFQNVIGEDSFGNQVSSISDLKILSEEVLKSSTLRKIMGTEVIEVRPKNSLNLYRFENTNDLLKSIPGTVGIKTGNTELAGECLSYLFSDNKREILIIILGSKERFEDTKKLLEWAKSDLNSQPKS